MPTGLTPRQSLRPKGFLYYHLSCHRFFFAITALPPSFCYYFAITPLLLLLRDYISYRQPSVRMSRLAPAWALDQPLLVDSLPLNIRLDPLQLATGGA